jgi:hypothetical protein
MTYKKATLKDALKQQRLESLIDWKAQYEKNRHCILYKDLRLQESIINLIPNNSTFLMLHCSINLSPEVTTSQRPVNMINKDLYTVEFDDAIILVSGILKQQDQKQPYSEQTFAFKLSDYFKHKTDL